MSSLALIAYSSSATVFLVCNSWTIETKSGVIQIADGTEYGHNAINIVNNTFLGTTAGITDEENSRGTRIGDR